MNNQPESETTCIPREIALQAAMFRLGDIGEEIEAGYNILRKHHKTVTIFGSARTPKDDPYFLKTVELSKRLAEAGYSIVSGGGQGIMRAANQGAASAARQGAELASGKSIAFNIRLPHEQSLNEYATDSHEFQHFSPRKIVMTMFADAYIYMPGGFGTLDELMEILTLIQTGKTNKAPVILFGRDFWNDLDSFIQKTMLETFHTISPDDLRLYTVTDDINDAITLIQSNKTYCAH